MSRREIVANTLLGIFLLVIFAALVLLAVSVIGFALHAADQLVKLFFPGLVSPHNVEFLGLLSLMAIVFGIRHLRERRWPSAFLSFAIVPMIVSLRLGDANSRLGGEGLFFVWPWLLIIAISANSPLRRSEFMLGALIISTAVAVNMGLLGSGIGSQIAASCVIGATFVWCVVQGRRTHKQLPASHFAATRV